MINFKKYNNSLDFLGVEINQVFYLHNICKVGDKGEQTIKTCKYLNNSKERGYHCVKLSGEYNDYLNSDDCLLKGDYCEGINELIELKLNIKDE